jgi:TnpA family transposase
MAPPGAGRRLELRQEIHEGLHLLQSALAHVNTLLM